MFDRWGEIMQYEQISSRLYYHTVVESGVHHVCEGFIKWHVVAVILIEIAIYASLMTSD